MKTKFGALKAAFFTTLLFEGVVYILPGPRDPDLLARMAFYFVLIFLFLYFVVLLPQIKRPPQRDNESEDEYLNRIERTLEEFGMTLKDVNLRRPSPPSPRQIRFDENVGKVGDWLEKNAAKIRKPLLILIGAGCGWYAIENQSWFAGFFCAGFFYEAVTSNPKKPN